MALPALRTGRGGLSVSAMCVMDGYIYAGRLVVEHLPRARWSPGELGLAKLSYMTRYGVSSPPAPTDCMAFQSPGAAKAATPTMVALKKTPRYHLYLALGTPTLSSSVEHISRTEPLGSSMLAILRNCDKYQTMTLALNYQ